MQHKKVRFTIRCDWCKRFIGYKYDYPPGDWNGKDEIITGGICDECYTIIKKEIENAKSKSKEGPREV